ncbi:MAG: hypothetical protein R2706_13510 [Acidimicrobiales bacterium]
MFILSDYSLLVRVAMPKSVNIPLFPSPLTMSLLRRSRSPRQNSRWRSRARLAERNIASDGGPFAAAVIDEAGAIVAAGVNRGRRLGPDCARRDRGHRCVAGRPPTWTSRCSIGQLTLVTTTEPCAMRLGAAVGGYGELSSAPVTAIARSAGFDEGNKPADWIAHLERIGISVVRDVLRSDAAEVLSRYAASGGKIYNGAQDA